MKMGVNLRSQRAPTLMLTSLLDMFTIILIFLIVSFEAESYEFRLNPDLVLPESSARAELKPAVNVAITDQGVFIGDRKVGTLQGDGTLASIQDGQLPKLVELLKEEHSKRFGEDAIVPPTGDDAEPVVVLQADKALKYKTLYVILRSAASAGFFKYRMAILKS